MGPGPTGRNSLNLGRFPGITLRSIPGFNIADFQSFRREPYDDTDSKCQPLEVVPRGLPDATSWLQAGIEGAH